ncbi:Reverse transcriptase zinc-binding domain [Macleaya cordata]|uniref:Reverse transcriptase zinc-binding domain n=1 Tax=Macleaya cordata TaxID=56857 RepID=A0A200Q885_MACCD|nr:Reverse transcriptase zinc-binding domain [Macleaya cordata]
MEVQIDRKLHYIGWNTISKPIEQGGLNIRDASLNDDFWNHSRPSLASSVWAGLTFMKHAVKDGYCWSIGDGKKIFIWEEPWIPSLSGFRVERPPLIEGRSIFWVCDLFRHGSKAWDEELLTTPFNSVAVQTILKIKIPEADVPDEIIWTKTINGQFTTKSLYRSLTVYQASSSSASSSSDFFPWSTFWKCKHISPRVLYFIWRVINNALAVRHNTCKFIHDALSDCPLCYSATETTDHLYMHCPFTQALWFASPLSLIIEDENLTVKDLISSWLSSHNGPTILHMGACLLWCLWKARNRLILDQSQPHIASILHQAALIFKDYTEPIEDIDSSAPNSITHSSNAKWIRPTRSDIKVNVDAAYKTPFAAAAAIARDMNGEFVSCIMSYFETSSPIEAEATTFLLGVKLAKNIYSNRGFIEGDSLQVVKAINDVSTNAPWRIRATVADILQFRRTVPELRFDFVPKKANSVAHALAQFTFTSRISDWWMDPHPPDCIVGSINLDKSNSLISSD